MNFGFASDAAGSAHLKDFQGSATELDAASRTKEMKSKNLNLDWGINA